MKKKLLFLSTAALMSLCACSGSGDKRESDSTQQTEETVKDPIRWERGFYADEFGKLSNKPYEGAILQGSFSNSATTNSDLTVFIFVDKDSTIGFELAKYNRSLAKNFVAKCKLRDIDGTIKNFALMFDRYGMAYITMPYDREFIKSLISKGEKDVLIIEKQDYGVPSTYTFSIPDGESIANAIKRLNN